MGEPRPWWWRPSDAGSIRPRSQRRRMRPKSGHLPGLRFAAPRSQHRRAHPRAPVTRTRPMGSRRMNAGLASVPSSWPGSSRSVWPPSEKSVQAPSERPARLYASRRRIPPLRPRPAVPEPAPVAPPPPPPLPEAPPTPALVAPAAPLPQTVAPPVEPVAVAKPVPPRVPPAPQQPPVVRPAQVARSGDPSRAAPSAGQTRNYEPGRERRDERPTTTTYRPERPASGVSFNQRGARPDAPRGPRPESGPPSRTPDPARGRGFARGRTATGRSTVPP